MRTRGRDRSRPPASAPDAHMLVVFTDVDGTLIDHATYSVEAARESVARLEERGVPLVLCSSKTRAEIERLRERLHGRHPFVSENGGGVFVPAGYFGFPLPGSVARDGYEVIELGRPHAEVVAALRAASAAAGIPVVAFSDLAVEQVARETGMPSGDAALALRREYDEPFRLAQPHAAGPDRLAAALAAAGFACSTGGRYHHAFGGGDKGRAVRILSGFFRSALGDLRTVGLGDALNDVPMLREVDLPVVVFNPASGATQAVVGAVPGARLTRKPGPEGWSEAIEELLA